MGRAHLVIGAVLVVLVGAGAFIVFDGDPSQHGQPPTSSTVVPNDPGPTATEFFKPGLEADIYRPHRAGPLPAVLLVHGGGLWTGSRADLPLARLAERLQATGMLAVSIDYTLNEGFEPPSRDVRDALGWLRTIPGVDPDRIALLGQSAGAALVAHTALQEQVRAMVLSSPAGGTEIVSTYASRDDPQTLVLRGADDTLASAEEVTALVNGLQDAGVVQEYRLVPGAGHTDVIIVDMAQLVAWLSDRLLE